MKYTPIVFSLLLFLCGLVSMEVHAQMEPVTDINKKEEGYLLLDKGLQFRITDAINSMYNFDFEKAERGFKVLRYTYPEHPLPYFLMGLSQWWKIVIAIDNESHDASMLGYMDKAIEKAEVLIDADPDNKEAAFFLAGAYGFQGRLYSERKNWTGATFASRNALKFLELSRGEEELSPELLLGDALYNYFSVWIRDNYPLLKPIMLLFPKGDQQLGLRQLEEVAKSAFYARIEAQYFLFRLYATEEKKPFKALEITKYLHGKYPNNPYFHRHFARQLYAVGRSREAKEVSLEILKRIDENWTGYEATSGRYAAFFIAQNYDRMRNYENSIHYYLRTLAFGDELGAQESGYYLFSALQLGKNYYRQGDNNKAKRYFDLVKENSKRRHPANKEAGEFLKKNKL
ncbi:tol-pal system protein YbgF [Cyclobacterium sp. 1_MG-2023]|uniref:tetratricopeptide repeat protein n=1 Tax=Cyclobacterium sp. 1_MG-2023 TaxID=3062681 RepID=UPI0026E489F2|nr:tol-pal system protein YbgF [Cyclobacterium sp. 1_MG-2023]MDO6439385.1 tol-pal system protein YbgF [Cyclobacterium sp. 1_MG-2023]